MSLPINRSFSNDELHLPKIIKEKFKEFEIDENTIFEWDIVDNKIILTPRQKVTLDDVIGMVKKEDDTLEDWNIDRGVYLNE